jgi:hypothetical protein
VVSICEVEGWTLFQILKNKRETLELPKDYSQRTQVLSTLPHVKLKLEDLQDLIDNQGTDPLLQDVEMVTES